MAGKTAATQDNFIGGLAWIHSTTADALARTSPLYLYMQLTGPYKTEEYTRRDNELTAAQKAIVENPDLMGPLLVDLFEFFHIASYKKLLGKYTAGQITPELQKILNYQPRVYETTIDIALNGGDFSEIVLQAVKAGKLDFTPFNDTEDKAPDWFLKYRLAPTPIPGYFGSIANINARAGLAAGTLDTYTGKIKKAIKIHIKNILDAGTPADTLREVTKEVRERYGIVKKKCEINNDNSIMNSVFPFVSPRMAGFAVDVKAGIIFDLRPHAEELRNALAPGAEPLKHFYLLVNRYLTNLLKGNNPQAAKTPGVLFENAPFLMMRNSRESNAIASVSGSMMQIAVQQELALQDDTGNPLYNYTANAPVKSGEVIISVKETPKGGVLRPSTEKLHILFDTLFTKSGYREFIFPIDGYMELCKRTPGEVTPESRRKFRQKLRQDLQRMQKATFSANLPGCKPGEIGILNAWLPAPNNCIYVKLESLYCNSLTQRNAGKMQLPKTIFKTNEQNPHLIPIMRALCRNRTDYHNINMGGNRARKISLKTLYEWDLSLPRWEKVNKGSKQFKRDIVEPLFNAIKELNAENYIQSKYVDKDEIEHTPAEIRAAGIVDILDPEKWLLFYEVVGFKDDPEMIKAAAERARQRDEKRIQEAAKRIAKAKKK